MATFRPLAVDVSDILVDTHNSNLKATAIAGASAITVYSISKFAIDQILLIGELGDEGSEIIKTHAATAPTGNTVTLASALVKTHPKDTKVYILLFDQIEFSHASTIGGSKTVLTTDTIDPERFDTLYVDSTNTGGYYFNRYKNSISGVFSDYTDPIPFEGFNPNTVASIIAISMKQMDKQFTDKLSYSMLIDEMRACLLFVRGKLKSWSNYQEFDYEVGQMNRGEYRWAVPETLYDKNSNRSVLGVRVGSGNNLLWKDKREFDALMKDVAQTTVATQPSVGQTTLVLTDTNDLSESGTVNIYYNNTLYAVEYTGNTQSTGTLTGIPASGDGSIAATFPVGTNVWQGESEGTPYCFTIYDGYLYILDLISSDEAGKNIYMDFYTDIETIDSDADVITPTRYDMMKHWLKWMIRNITEKNGDLNLKDGDFIMFNTILNDAIRRERSGQRHKMKPKINGISYRGRHQSTGDFLRS